MKLASAASALLLAAAMAARTSAQPTGRTLLVPAGQAEAVPAPRAHTSGVVSARFGHDAADRLLSSSSREERLRGIERLQSNHDRASVDELLRALEPGSLIGRDGRARLLAVRGLMGTVGYDRARAGLTQVLRSEPGSDPLRLLVRQTAALALAEGGDAKGVEILMTALRAGGAVSSVAREALLAHGEAVRRTLDRTLSVGQGDAQSPSLLDAELAGLYGRLGVTRAVPALRETLAAARTDESTRLAAALALARLGDTTQIAAARSWIADPDSKRRFGGAEVLVASGNLEAAPSVAALFELRELREGAFRLADELLSRRPLDERGVGQVALALVRLLAEGHGPNDATVLRLLGRLGDSNSCQALAAALLRPDRAGEAAHALATSHGSCADEVLARALESPETRRWAARAAAVRFRLARELVRGLDSAIGALERSESPADRAAGAFAHMVVRPLPSLLASSDPVVARSAAGALLVAGRESVAAAVARLESEEDLVTRSALGLSLGACEGLDEVSTRTILAWSEGSSAFAPLALVALGHREASEALERRIADPNALVRVHAARALGQNADPSSALRLARAWKFETAPIVRRAIVRALARRTEPTRRSTLRTVAQLDPDPSTREAAREALDESRPPMADHPPRSCLGEARWKAEEVAWVQSRANADLLIADSGLALPVASDPDGVVIVPGIPDGNGPFELASWPLAGKLPGHDSGEVDRANRGGPTER